VPRHVPLLSPVVDSCPNLYIVLETFHLGGPTQDFRVATQNVRETLPTINQPLPLVAPFHCAPIDINLFLTLTRWSKLAGNVKNP